MTKKKDNRPEHVKASMKAQAGHDRREYFDNGGTPIGWLGGPHTIVKNNAKYTRKQKHKGEW